MFKKITNPIKNVHDLFLKATISSPQAIPALAGRTTVSLCSSAHAGLMVFSLSPVAILLKQPSKADVKVGLTSYWGAIVD